MKRTTAIATSLLLVLGATPATDAQKSALLQAGASVKDGTRVELRWQISRAELTGESELLIATRGKSSKSRRPTRTKFTAKTSEPPPPETETAEEPTKTTSTLLSMQTADAPTKTVTPPPEPEPEPEPAPEKTATLVTAQQTTATPEKTTAITGTTETPQKTTVITGTTETPQKTTTVTATTEIPQKTTTVTATTEIPQKTTTVTATTEMPQETTTVTGTTETPQKTTAITGTTEAPQKTTTVTGTTETPQKTTTVTGTTEIPQKTTTVTGTTEAPQKTTTVTGTTEIPQKTTTVTGTTEIPQKTTTVTGTTEIPQKTTTVTGTKTLLPGTTTTTPKIGMSASDILARSGNRRDRDLSVDDVRKALAGERYRSEWTSKLSAAERPAQITAKISRSMNGGRFLPVDAESIPATVLTKRRDGSYYVGAFTDHDVERGRNYRYKISLVRDGAILATADVLDVDVHDGRPPRKVEGLTATEAAETITLSWAALDDDEVLGYRVYREPIRPAAGTPTRRAASLGGSDELGQTKNLALDAGMTQQFDADAWLDSLSTRVDRASFLQTIGFDARLAELPKSTTQYVDRTAEEGVSYNYRVVAYDRFSGEGDAGLPRAATLLDVRPPDRVRSPRARPAAGGVIDVDWGSSPSADTTAYRVYRITNGGSPVPVSIVAADSALAYRDHLDPYSDDTYAYRVLAFDAANNASAASDTAVVELPDIRAPEAPTLSQLDTGDGTVRVTWIAPPDADVQGYRVYRRSGTRDERIASNVTARQYVDRTGLIGGRYTYRVTAVDEVGNESEPSAEHEQRVVGDVDARAPAGVRVVTSRSGTRLTWAAIEGYADTSYVVMTAPSSKGPWRPVSAPLDKPGLDLPRGIDESVWFAVIARYFTGDVSTPSTPVSLAQGGLTGGR